MAVSRMTLGGLASGMDTDSMIEKLMEAHRYKVNRYKKRNISNDYRREEWKKMNSKIYSFFSKELTTMRLKGKLAKNKTSSSNASVADADASANAPKGTHELDVLQLAKTAATASGALKTTANQPITGSTKLSEMGIATGEQLNVTYKDKNGVAQTVTVTADANDTVSSFAEKIKQATKGKIDMDANADIKNGRLFLSTKNSGEKQSFTLSGTVAAKFGFTSDEVKGQDAKYRYNGMEFTSESNSVEFNGIKATLKSVGQTTISVSRDTEAAYKQIIDFFKKYNALVKEMQDKVNIGVPRSQRDMQPLLDEERKGMSEANAKKWEETLRGRIFKGDKNLKEILNDMRTSFTTMTNGNGKYNALSSLGISTGNHKLGTGSLMFVDGDSELGGKRADMPNKLKKALEEDPEAVEELLTKIAQDLSDKLSNKMKSTTLRSYMSFYDDKALQEEHRQLERRIHTMEDKLLAIEEKYRRQFVAMEKALAKSNSTSNWLTQQMGGGRR